MTQNYFVTHKIKKWSSPFCAQELKCMVFFSISVHNIAIISFVISVDRNVQQNVISFCHERNAVCGTIQSVHKKWPCYKWYALKKILSKTFLLEHLESWLLFLDSYMVKKLFQELWFNPSALWGISFCWVIQSARGKRVQIRNGNNDRQWWDKKKKKNPEKYTNRMTNCSVL